MLSGSAFCQIAFLGALTDDCHSKTVSALDVFYALKRSGRMLYGFGA